ncbi:glyoxalase/bleomycin resistance protein/dioxygenase [Aspergillus crustosus]
MTINHIFVYLSAANHASLRTWYRTVLAPIGYNELVSVFSGTQIGLGSDYPYLWLKKLPEGTEARPVHIAFDAPNWAAVDEFYKIALENGAKDNGAPGIRPEMGRQPYYSAFVLDKDGNNVEAVCAPRPSLNRTQ